MEKTWAEKPRDGELNWKQYPGQIGAWNDHSFLRTGGNHSSHKHAHRATCSHGLLGTIAKAKCWRNWYKKCNKICINMMKYVLGWMLSGMSIILNWVVALAVLDLWLDSTISRFFANLNHSVILSCEANQMGYNWFCNGFVFLTAQNTPSLCWDDALKGNLAPPDLPFTRRAGRGLPQPPGEGQCADAGSKPQGCAGGGASHVCPQWELFLWQSLQKERRRAETFSVTHSHSNTQRERTRQTPKGEPWAKFCPALCHLQFYWRH